MNKKGVEFAHECLIFERCHPAHPHLCARGRDGS
jgi:hypothetical protein